MTFRSTWTWTGLTLLIFVLFLVVVAQFLLVVGWAADPVRIHVTGLSAEAVDKVRFIVIDPGGKGWYGTRVGKTNYWYIGQVWVSELHLRIPEKDLGEIAKLNLTFGDNEYSVPGEEVQTWERRHPHDAESKGLARGEDILLRVPNLFRQTTRLPWVRSTLMNWPGDVYYLRAVGQYALVPILVTGLLIFWGWQRRTPGGQAWSQRILGLDTQAKTPTGEKLSGSTGWNWKGIVFLVGALAFLEVREPFYFTQCDNFVECLPQILVGCRSYWRGEFPHYNPYLFLGSPLANLGIYSLTYPPLHVSYGLARHVLGQENATLEVFAILHLLVGYFVARALGRQLGMGSLSTNLLALAFVLSGPALIMGRCWFNFVPLFVWMPVLFLGLVRLVERPVSWKWVLGMGLAMGITFHVGFSPPAIYLNSLFCLAVVFYMLTGALTWKRALPVLPALILGAGIAMPLVYQQWNLVQGFAARPVITHQGIGKSLPAIFLPYPLVQVPLSAGWGNAKVEYLGHFYFFGGVLAFLFLVQVMGFFVFPPGKKHWASHAWTFLSLGTFWLALGDDGGLWTLLTRMPVLGFIHRHPLRMMPFVVFFTSIAGAMVLDRWLQGATGRKERIVAGLAGFLLLVHVVQSQTAFVLFQVPPYPPLPEAMQKLLWEDGQSTGRVSSWVRENSPYVDYGLLLPQNLPAVHNIPTISGLNAILTENPLLPYSFLTMDLAGQQAYGVRWLITNPSEDAIPLSSNYGLSWTIEVTSNKGSIFPKIFGEKAKTILVKENVALHELAGARPLAFPGNNPNQGLSLHMGSQGLKVDIAGLEGNQKVVVNFLHYPEMQAFVDGQSVTCEADRWFRMVVKLPREGKVLTIRYRPSWSTGVWLGLGLAGMGIGFGLVFFRRDLKPR